MIQWDCPLTNKECIDNYLYNYLTDRLVDENIKVNNIDIINNISGLIDRYNRKDKYYLYKYEIREQDIKRLYLLRKKKCRELRVKYIEKCIHEVLVY